jgi:transposase
MGILWRLRVGSPWRDLPEEFGPWHRIYRQFNRWSRSGLIDSVFASFAGEADDEWNMIDSTINRAHQHSAGARIGEERAIGASRGGLSSKVHAVCDAHGNPTRISITEGQRHDAAEAPNLLQDMDGEVLIGDKGYDSEELRNDIVSHGAEPVIPYRESTKHRPHPFDATLYKARHVIENMFARLKQMRAFATRYDKLKRNYQAMVAMACSVLWVKVLRN